MQAKSKSNVRNIRDNINKENTSTDEQGKRTHCTSLMTFLAKYTKRKESGRNISK